MVKPNDLSLGTIEIVIEKIPTTPFTRDGYTDYSISLCPVKRRLIWVHKIVGVCDKDSPLEQEAEICANVKYIMQDLYQKIRGSDKLTKRVIFRNILKKVFAA